MEKNEVINSSFDGRKRLTSGGLKKKYNRELLLITIPALIKVFLFSFLPLVWLVMAFQFYKPIQGILGSQWVGFDNFKFLIQSNSFWKMIRNAFVMNVMDIVVSNVVSIVLGLLMFELLGKLRVKILQTLFFFPYFITWAIAGSLLNTTIGDNGFLTKLIATLIGKTYEFYSMPNLWWGIIVLMGVWKGAGVSAVVNYAVLLGSDKEMYEAAEIDGANRYHKAIHLSLPYMKIMIIVNIVIACSNLIRYDFSRVYFLTENNSMLSSTTEVIETYMYKALRFDNNFEQSTAAGLLQSVVGLILCTIANYITKKVSPESSLF